MALDPITAVLNIGSQVIDKIFPDKTEAAKAKVRLMELDQEGALAGMANQVKVLLAEMSGNWLQKSWRPILMLSVVAIVVNNYIAVPYLQLFGIEAIVLDLPDKLWNLMTLGMSGYVVGRSAEKIVEQIKK